MLNESNLGIHRGYENKYTKKEQELLVKDPNPQVVSFAEKNRIGNGSKVLDLGSGFGNNLEYLASKGCQVTGIELSSAGVGLTKKRLANKNLSARVEVGDIEHLPIVEEEYGSFDAAISRRVFDYNDTQGVLNKLKEAARMLKKDGLFLLIVRSCRQAPKGNETKLEENKWGGSTYSVKTGMEAGARQHYFSEEELIFLAAEAGFEVVDNNERNYKGQKDGSDKFEWVVTLRKV